MRQKNIFVALVCASVLMYAMCASKPTRPPPYLDIETFYKQLGRLWILVTATATRQNSTTCKVYDVTKVENSVVHFGRIFYRKGRRKEKRLEGKLENFEHPILKEMMKYKGFMTVTPRGETTFYEYLLYQSRDFNCGVFHVKSGYQHFHELRLWNYSAVSAYKECLQNYVYHIQQGDLITMYYNGLCPYIFRN
ncbi:uncharacterized protein [Dermacentor andersoni]|uniref:uncharacterized protein n=1 Tax=Dermacentor andersoni TaxID=34620 RepID=UPI003B3ADE0C